MDIDTLIHTCLLYIPYFEPPFLSLVTPLPINSKIDTSRNRSKATRALPSFMSRRSVNLEVAITWNHIIDLYLCQIFTDHRTALLRSADSDWSEKCHYRNE